MRTRTRYPMVLIVMGVLLVAGISGACSSSKSRHFQLSKEDFAVSSDESRNTTIYLTGTRPVDSLATGEGLLADISRLEIDDFPEEIRAYVRVFDSAGKFITNMADPYYHGRGDYRTYWKSVTENLVSGHSANREVPIKNYTVREFGEGDSIPYAISLVLDHGGSMGGTIEALQDGAEIFIKLKRSYDKIAVIKFSNEPLVSVELSDDKTELLQAFSNRGLQGYGQYTALYRAAIKGIDLLKDQPAGSPRVLVLFTDGVDNNSESNAIDVYQKALEHNVHIFPIGFGYANDDTLRALAEKTGGKFYKAYSRRELAAVFQDIYLSLRNYYRVTYTPPHDPLLHEVEIALTPPDTEAIIARSSYDKSILDDAIWARRPSPFDTSGEGGGLSTGGDPGILSNVFFGYDQDTLKPSGREYLKTLAADLNENSRVELRIVGHTDNAGTEEYNLALSKRRAKAVVDFLIVSGVDSSRLDWDGKGYAMPIASNDTEEGRARNRRVEFVVLKY